MDYKLTQKSQEAVSSAISFWSNYTRALPFRRVG